MKSIFLTCAISCVAVFAGNAMADSIVYQSDFQANSTADFTGGSLQTSPSGTIFLAPGGPGDSTTLTLTGLDPHSDVSLSFTLDVVGSMDGGPNPDYGGGSGDFFDVAYSGDSSGNVFNYTFANYGDGNTQDYLVAGTQPAANATTINALGYSGFPNSGNNIQDSEYAITLTPIVDSDGTFSFTFTDNSNEGFSNEFYGIDNVVVSTDADSFSATPEPGTIALLGLGLCALPLIRRRVRV